jgi:(E)-4-hydroxy-3-methylbut-2-enyl-diphosphate synthase
VYVDGEKTVTLRGDNIAREFQQIVDDYVKSKYALRAPGDKPKRRILIKTV